MDDRNAENKNVPKKRKLLKILLPIIVLCGIAVVILFTVPIGANISRQEASQIAVEHIGGGVAARPDIDWKGFQRAWYVEVFYDRVVYAVYVSTRTGEVIGVDRWVD